MNQIKNLYPFFSFFLLLPFICIFPSCNKEKDFDCFKSTGNIVKVFRTTPSFSKILLQGNIHLVFIPDTIQKIEIEAGENLIPKITTTVENDSLILDNRNYCNWVRSFENEVTIYIYGNPGLKLYHKGYGKVSGNIKGNRFFIKSWSNETTELELNVNQLWLESFKLGNTFLSGSIENAQIFRHETGKIDMNNTSWCKKLIYHDHGQGKSIIRADEKLEIKIFDSGEVLCTTNPDTLIIYGDNKKGKLKYLRINHY